MGLVFTYNQQDTGSITCGTHLKKSNQAVLEFEYKARKFNVESKKLNAKRRYRGGNFMDLN